MAQGPHVAPAHAVRRVAPAAAATGTRRPGDDSASHREGITLITSQRGPTRIGIELVGADEQPLGALRLAAGASAQTFVLGARALDEGVLLGRYARCDTHGASVIDIDGNSRVHLLVLRIDDVVYAVDTASTNGTYLAGEEVRIARLSGGTGLVLGDDLARLQWRAP